MNGQDADTISRMVAQQLAEHDAQHAREIADLKKQIEKTSAAVAEMLDGGLFDSVKSYIDRRVDKIAGKRQMSFHGPHDPQLTYGPGSVVQRQSQTWVSLVSTTEMPGQSSHWRRLGA